MEWLLCCSVLCCVHQTHLQFIRCNFVVRRSQVETLRCANIVREVNVRYTFNTVLEANQSKVLGIGMKEKRPRTDVINA